MMVPEIIIAGQHCLYVRSVLASNVPCRDVHSTSDGTIYRIVLKIVIVRSYRGISLSR